MYKTSFMNTISINLNGPKGWYELDDAQLRFAYSLIAKEFSADEIKTLALLKWATPKVRVEGLGENIFVRSTLGTPLSTLNCQERKVNKIFWRRYLN